MVMGRLGTKLRRDVLRHKGQFLAASVVVMCGLAVYVSLYSVYNNLRVSRDGYYRQFHFADFFIELERAPVSALRLVEAIPGVLQVCGRIVKDVPLDVEGNEESVIGRFISMPAKGRPPINDIHIVSGSYFTGTHEHEVIVNQRFCEANELRPGDSFSATINGRKEQLHIVGTVYSPEYVYPIRNAQQFAPNDRGFGIVFVQKEFAESAFNMGSAVNNVVGRVRPGADVEGILEVAERRLKPYGVYHHYGREMQLSNRYVSEEIRGLRGSAVILPAVFLLIAGLIIHVIMSRITEQQRTQIGLLCALGYTKAEIVFHYLGYAVVVAALGAGVGAPLGQFLASQLMKLYRPFFRFPAFETRFYPELFATAFAVSSGACVAGMLSSVMRVVRLQPAEAMRPPTPPSGRRILLERVGFVWNRLSLEWRTVLRGICRARMRTLLTVVGVTAATVILIVGLTTLDFFVFLMEFQFNMVDRSDLHVDLISERPASAVAEIGGLDGVRRAEGILQYGFELRNGWRKKTVLVMGLPSDGELHAVYDSARRRLTIPEEGFLVPDRLAKMLEVSRGSRIIADPYVRGKDEVPACVEGVAEQFVGLTVYADRRYLCDLLGEAEMVNAVLATVDEPKFEHVVDELDGMPGVSGAVANRRIMEGLEETVQSMMNIMTFALSAFAAVIAFAVIYNSSAINVSERERELASMRAQGLGSEEVARIGTDDIMPLGVLGIVLGVPLGRLACSGVARLYETDIYKMPAVTYPRTYVIAVALVVVFLLASRRICKRRVARIDIIRALKTRE